MKVQEVINVFEGFRMKPSNIDQFETGGREAFAQQLGTFVNNNRRIEFVMLGYPFKSTNHRDKTIGVLPDMAEEVSIRHFRRFGEAIRAVYDPGIKLTIASDGYIFNDLLSEDDRIVEEYGDVTRGMMRDVDAPVEIISLRTFYPHDPVSVSRERVMNEFGVNGVELERRILFDPNVNALYRGMIRFMEEELANRQFESKSQLHKSAKKLARRMICRNEGYSAITAHEYAHAIRLSMHPSTNNGKYSFQLIPGPRSMHSPWHCALLVEGNGQYSTIHKKDAEAAGYTLVSSNGRPYFYVKP